MRRVVDALNRQSLPELLNQLPPVARHTGQRATFDYRIYSRYRPDEVEVVYVLINGFAEQASWADSGLKNLIADRLLQQTEPRRYAVLAVSGLFSFPFAVRKRLLPQGSGALAVIADEVAELLSTAFPQTQQVIVGGYSLGGVLAPLVAQAIDERGDLRVEQVSCGEPNYTATASSKLELLRRVSHATAYRNDQIKATAIASYITIKQTPSTKRALWTYRATQYRPLLRDLLSMRLIAQDLALQAHDHPLSSRAVQVETALLHLTKRGIRLNLLHADYSPLCDKRAFMKLAARLRTVAGDGQLTVIRIRGQRADHGIEEHRTLSTPFLVAPQTYWET